MSLRAVPRRLSLAVRQPPARRRPATRAWIAAALLAASSGRLLAAEAATFRGNLQRSGVFDARPGRGLEGLKWTFPTRGPLRASPTVAGDLVLFGSGDGNLYAAEIATGRERWRAPLGSAVHSTPAVQGDRVFVTSRRGGVFALDLASGRRVWTFAAGSDLPFVWGWDYWMSSPAVEADTVYVGSGDGRLYAIDAASGKERWRFQTGARVRSSPALADGVVYVGSRDGKVYAVDAKTGRKLWDFASAGFSIDSSKAGYDRTSIDSTTALSPDRLFVGSRDGHEYALDRRTGALRWRFGHRVGTGPNAPEVSWVEASPAIWNDLVLVGSSDGHLFHATRAATGKEVWRFPTPDRVFSSAAVANGIAFFGCEDGHFFALEAATGAELWRYRASAPIHASPALSGSLVFFGSDDGKLYALTTAGNGRSGRTRRAVFWTNPGPWKWFEGDVAVRDYFVSEGYELLDAAALPRWFAAPDAQASVAVMANDRFPDDVVPEPFESCPLRRYLASGGRVVWLGLSPLLVTIDPKTGQPAGLDYDRARRFLGVRQNGPPPGDLLGSTVTEQGKAWGLPDWWIGGLEVPESDVTTVLGRDEEERASAWIKTFGGPPGSGFVRVWGRADSPADLSWVKAVAEH